jgi:hypothetical protein
MKTTRSFLVENKKQSTALGMLWIEPPAAPASAQRRITDIGNGRAGDTRVCHPQ